MSHPSSPEFIDASNPISRVDSSETVDSPFGSNLATPNDEDAYPTSGIHQRLDFEPTICGYFPPRLNSTGSQETFEQPISDILKLGDINQQTIQCELEDNVHVEVDIDVTPADTFDSVDSLSSPLSSLCSAESLRRAGAQSIYTLPNDHIIVNTPPNELNAQLEIHADDDDVLGPKDFESSPLLYHPKAWSELTDALSESFLDIIILGLKILCFLPWCVIVGGAIVVCPQQLDWLVFGTGYIEPLSGIRRYSHWATYGFQHIVAFFTFLGAVIWQHPDLGCLFTGALLGQFCLAWHNFLLDSTVPLGEDNRHTVYLLATTTWLDHNNSINIKKLDETYYWTERSSLDEVDMSSD